MTITRIAEIVFYDSCFMFLFLLPVFDSCTVLFRLPQRSWTRTPTDREVLRFGYESARAAFAAVDAEVDAVDKGRRIRGKKEYGLGDFFRPTPAALE